MSELQLSVNGETRNIAGEQTIAGLLEDLGVTAKHVAVELNGELVPRTLHAEQTLANGDSLEIVTLVGGG